MSQPFAVAESVSVPNPAQAPKLTKQFTGMKGALVPLSEAVTAFEEILDGKHDSLPEAAFYMVGGIQDVKDKAARLIEESK